MIRLFIALLLIAGVSFSCKNIQKTVETEKKTIIEEVAVQVSEEADKAPEEVVEKVQEQATIKIAKWVYPENTIAGIKRTYCFGKCPVYEMILLDDFTLVYTGKANVDKIGNYEAKATQEDFNNLVAFANEVGYFDFNDQYVGDISDLPTTYTTLKVGDKQKAVVNLFMGPDELGQFEKYFDQLFANKDWQKAD